jgi:hypothetical protein
MAGLKWETAPGLQDRTKSGQDWNLPACKRGLIRPMTASAPAADYPLYFRDATGFVWSIATRGLRLSDEGLTFTSERETRTIRYSELRSIRLHTAHANTGETPIGICRVGFGRFRTLTIFSGDSMLCAEEAQRAAYHAFVRDFHRRIPPADRVRIAFNGGLSDTRHMILSIAMLAGGALFGVLPLVLLFLVPSWHTLGVAASAWVLAYAGWKTWTRNRPRPYLPDRIPDDLLP